MHKALRGCQVGAALSAVGLLVFYTHVWNPADALAPILLTAVTVLTILGIAPLIVRDLVWRAMRVELQAFRAQLQHDLWQEITAAREEGVRDGALRARLGRVAGDPPTPRPRGQLRAVDE